MQTPRSYPRLTKPELLGKEPKNHHFNHYVQVTLNKTGGQLP